MASVFPAVLAENPHQYREQVERVAPFTTHVHIDFMDGSLTDSTSTSIAQAWWPHTMQADLHIMFKDPTVHLESIIPLNPRLVIVHSEAEGDLAAFAGALHQAGIQFGVAIMPETKVSNLRPLMAVLDHVLIFSGNLGHFGGQADLGLLEKVTEIKKLNEKLTIGWDGGVNDRNAARLVAGGVDILNVGGFIQRSEDPHQAYDALVALTR